MHTAFLIGDIPVAVAVGESYEISGISFDNIGNVSTTCGQVLLNNDGIAQLLVHTQLCGQYGCRLCVLNLYGTGILVASRSLSGIQASRLPMFTETYISLTEGITCNPISLPPINNYIQSKYAQNAIYSFDPPLPAGLLMIGSHISGVPTTADTLITVTISAVDVFTQLSVPIGIYLFDIRAPQISSTLSSGSIAAVVIGSILGMALLLFLIFIIRQRRKARQPYDFSALVAETIAEIPAIPQEQQRFPRELSRSSVKEVEVLGKGSFGEVSKGLFTEKGMPGYLVAVKSLLNSTDRATDRLQLLSEASLMVQFDHENVVRLIGVVTSGDPMLVVLEYCEGGSLERVVQICRLTSDQQLKMSLDCAKGMAYLASLKYVHRDLAARNVMVSSDFVAKIGDFGMSRVTVDSEYYISKNATISIRWSSPEALEERRFSEQSDAWSYGVLLYELWSHGELPYNGLPVKKVWSEVIKGLRLSQPPDCPRDIYSIMRLCWADYGDRPVFTQLIDMLMEYEASGEELSIKHSYFSDNSDDIPNITVEAPVAGYDSGNHLHLTPKVPQPDDTRKVSKVETVV